MLDNRLSTAHTTGMSNTTSAQAPALTLHAYQTPSHLESSIIAPTHFEFVAVLPTREDAAAFVANFPKSCKLWAGTLTIGSTGKALGYVQGHGSLTSNGVNGGVNESGLRRYHAIVKAAAKLGIGIEYVANAGNSYPTRESFEAAIAGEAQS